MCSVLMSPCPPKFEGMNVQIMHSNPGGQGEMGQEIRNALFAANAAEDGATLNAPESRYTSSHRSDREDVPPQPTTPPSSGGSDQPNAQSLKSRAKSIAQQWTNSQQPPRSEEHTSELQSRGHLVCR